VGLAHYVLEDNFSSLGVVVVGSKTSPLGKLLFDALELKLMGHTKDAVVRGNGLFETRVRCQIRPRVKPTLNWRVKTRVEVSGLGLGVGVGGCGLEFCLA
jgi:hypothetical protein